MYFDPLSRSWWRDSFAGWIVVVILAGVCAGCGFRPLLGETSNPQVRENLAQVKVDMILDRSGQILRNYLIDDLNPNGVQGSARYSLRVVLVEPRREAAIQRDNTASRITYSASATFTLFDTTRRVYVFSGSSVSETTYEVTTSEYATVSSLNGARDRVLQDVSADIRQQVADFFAVSAAQAQR